MLSPVSHENTTETSLTSKKCCLAKFCKVDSQSQALLFTGEASYSSRFFSNTPKISAQIEKPTKYQSIFYEKDMNKDKNKDIANESIE